MDFFYNRSAYRLIEKSVDIPLFFRSFDLYLKMPTTKRNVARYYEDLSLAENICRRMGDVEYYATQISKQLSIRKNLFDESVLVGTFLVSYYAACASLLDAMAISLNKTYQLNLKSKKQSLLDKQFKLKLKQADKQIYQHFFTHIDMFNQIREWRDSSIHRQTPMVIVVGPGDPTDSFTDKHRISLLSVKDPDRYELYQRNSRPKFVDPLHHHKKWRPNLINLCEQTCNSILNKSPCKL